MIRFTFFSCCILLLSFTTIYAQVTAGVTDNLIIGQESVHLTVFAPNSGDYDIRHDSLDFNGDGQYDALFTAEAAWVPDYVGGFTGIQALHPGFEIILHSTDVRALALGDSINETQTWSDSNTLWDLYSTAFVSRFWGITGQLYAIGDWLPPTSIAYAGFRIITAQHDTLYGWFRVTAGVNPNGSPSAGLTVNGLWAIEAPAVTNQPVDFVIAGGVTSNLIPGNDTMALNQGPIPFGGGTGELDSLDLNQDGIHDVVFNVTLCNTFDCVQSSTLCIGMHEGFNFVMGPMDARQFDTDDTIFANANWNAVPTSHKIGLFAQQGIGFNGFQSAGEWLNDNDGYLGFRLVTPASDTLLGWIHIYTYSLAENGAYLEILGWAIQHDPAQKPYVKVAATPEKAVYCRGDYVILEANAVGAEQIMWHFWDGSSDTAATVTKILPDSTVTVTFEATNQNGTTTTTQIMEVSPLMLTAPDITLDCAHPVGTLSAGTNIPADICWVVGADTTCDPTPPALNLPVPVTVIAQDAYGCIATEQIEISLDVTVPDVSIEFDEANHLLIAHSAVPNVIFEWVTTDWSVTDDTIVVSQSGTYTVVAIAPNGCTSSASITVVIASASEPSAGSVQIQPNPASDFLQIENGLSSDLALKIFDAAGSLTPEAGTVAANSVVRLDIVSLPGGIYLLTGYDPNGKPLFSRKFVKQ